MDPVFIVSLAAALTQDVYLISTFIAFSTSIESTLAELQHEVEGLGNVLKSIEQSLKALAEARKGGGVVGEAELWTSLAFVIKDAERTITALRGTMQGLVGIKSTGLLKRMVKRAKLKLNTDEITAIRARIHTHTSILQAALQMVSMLITSQSSDQINEIGSKLNRIVQDLKQLKSNQATTNDKLPLSFRNLYILTHTERLISSANTVIDQVATFWEGIEMGVPHSPEAGGSLDKAKKSHIEDWIPQLTIMEEEDLQTSKSKVEEAGLEGEEIEYSDSDGDDDHDIAQTYFAQAEELFRKKEHAKAIEYFHAGLDRATTLSFERQSRLDLGNIKRELALSLLHQGSLTEAEDLFQKLARGNTRDVKGAELAYHASSGLAQVFICKRLYTDAEVWCKNSRNGWRRALKGDKRHPLYFDALKLSAFLCELQGDATQALVYGERAEKDKSLIDLNSRATLLTGFTLEQSLELIKNYHKAHPDSEQQHDPPPTRDTGLEPNPSPANTTEEMETPLAFSDDISSDSPKLAGDAAAVNARSSLALIISAQQESAQYIPRGEVIGSEGPNHDEYHFRRTAFEDSAYGTVSHGQLSGVKVASPTDFNDAERRIDDTHTEYSEISMAESGRHAYMECLADDLYALASKIQIDPQLIQTLSESLPELLQNFALRIGQEIPRKDGREVMFYVYKYRRRIAKLFEQNFSDWNDVQEDSASHLSESIPFRERVTEWLSQEDPDPTFPENADEPSTGVPEVDGWDDVEKYKELVSRTSSYTWLLANVAREIAQTSDESYLLKQIRDEVSRRLPPIIKVSPRRAPDTTMVWFQMEWDPMAFILEQRYSENPSIVLERAITLTGSPTNAQALPCLQYLIQAWPCSGAYIACLLKKLTRARVGQHVFVHLSDGSDVTAWSAPAIVHVRVSGTRGSIIEVGEQIAWLGAALRSSPYDSIAYCRPQIEDGSWTTEQHRSLRYDPEQEKVRILRIKFSFDPEDLGIDRQSQGRCWYHLFRNPVVVPGFPILKRSSDQYGLELPLNMIAGLLQVKRAHIFGDVVFIKGYSVMLVPSKQSDGLVVWHVLYNADGSRISYLDNDLPPLQDVGFENLQKSRHIVGWCPHAKSHAGGIEANYIIERSKLPSPGPGCMLEKVSLNGGKYITAGIQFAIGVKDVPIHIPCKPYVQKLRWVSSKFIVLWDVADRRGWLVKGISALLHLIRASLKYYETDAFSTALLSKYDDIQEPSTAFQGDHSIGILLDERNMKLPIYPEKDEVQHEDSGSRLQDPRHAPKTRKVYYRVEDRVEEIYETLEKLIDHQTNATGQAGVKMKAHARRRLEGWDFKDLASDKDPIYPRITTLHALGKGWVDFVRSIQAVTLFGRGFGEIIRPSTAVTCRYWSEVPRDKFYLAACVIDLQQIMETDGDHIANPMRVCNGILWHSSNAAFDACRCAKSRDSRHSDFVQTLWPISLGRLLPRRERMLLLEEGAVIFGHNVNFKWKWEDVGDPIQGDPDQEDLALAEDEFHDSGIGMTDIMASEPCDQGLSVNGSNEMTSLWQSQTSASNGPAPGEASAGLANLTAANKSTQQNPVENSTRRSKQISFGHRTTRLFSMPRFIQRRKEGGQG